MAVGKWSSAVAGHRRPASLLGVFSLCLSLFFLFFSLSGRRRNAAAARSSDLAMVSSADPRMLMQIAWNARRFSVDDEPLEDARDAPLTRSWTDLAGWHLRVWAKSGASHFSSRESRCLVGIRIDSRTGIAKGKLSRGRCATRAANAPR